MDIHLHFNERKATQAAAYLLKLRGNTMSYMKLIKLLYLADREALLRWGRSITTDSFVSMDRGPVLSHVLNMATEEDLPGDRSFWSQHIGKPLDFSVSLLNDAGAEELSEAELHLLNEIFNMHGHKDRWTLVNLVHQLPEWVDPHGSAIPISYRDILKAGGKKESEIAAIEGEIEDVSSMETLLGAC